MNAPKIAIVGHGKMGGAIEQLARERSWTITAVIGHAENERGASLTRDRLGDADVVIEMSTPASAPDNVLAAARAGYAVVTGTTGWSTELPKVQEQVRTLGGAMIWASNFSIGVNLYFAIARHAARVMRAAESFGAAVVETHHSAKKDAPSGTAISLQRIVANGLGRDVPVTSVRVGSVPGTHELLFDGPFEQIRFVHEARDRRVFADGALLAASWVRGRTGIFTMTDVLGIDQ